MAWAWKRDAAKLVIATSLFGAIIQKIISILVNSMERAIDYRSFGRSDKFGYSVEISLAQTLDTFEMCQQSSTCLLADTLYPVKLRHGLRLAATVAMVCYAEAVSFVAQLLHNTQRF